MRRGENRSTRRKTSRSKDENRQQTQPTYDAESGTRTWARLVRGECSHHWAIPAPPIKQHHYKRSSIPWSYEFISLLLYLTFHQISPLLPSSPLPRLKSYCDINFHKPNTYTVNCCCRLIGCFGNALALVFKDLPSRESSWASFLHPLHKLKHIYCQVLRRSPGPSVEITHQGSQLKITVVRQRIRSHGSLPRSRF